MYSDLFMDTVFLYSFVSANRTQTKLTAVKEHSYYNNYLHGTVRPEGSSPCLKSPTIGPNPEPAHAVLAFTNYFSKIQFNILLPSTSRFNKCSLSE
jgi:hypothetical protein